MEKMTITEALAEVPLAKKKITQAETNILRYLARPEERRDPLEDEGGSEEYVVSQLQSIEDNWKRLVRIRMAIGSANTDYKVTVGEYTKTIEAWLIWRREVYPYQQRLYDQMVRRIDEERKGDRIQQSGSALGNFQRFQQQSQQTEYPGKGDVKVEYDEKHLAELVDVLEETNGKLDGRLTLFNSTVEIEF